LERVERFKDPLGGERWGGEREVKLDQLEVENLTSVNEENGVKVGKGRKTN